MKKIGLLYDSVSGSTAEIADLLNNELSEKFYRVDIIPVYPNCDLSNFDTVILGSPMRFGSFTSNMRKFIEKNKDWLKDKQVFIYITLLYITRINNKSAFEIPCYIDPSLNIQAIEKKDASLIDQSHAMDYYHKKMALFLLNTHPQGIAFFNGRLATNKLPLFERLFMKLVIRLTAKEKEGDFINSDAVREWAGQLFSYI